MDAEVASLFQRLGAAGFGVIVGWNLYYLNRYRTGEVKIADLASVVGTLGGTAVLALFPAETDLFGAYGIGLFVGFFGYLAVLAVLVWKSPNFDRDWFLDGRRTPDPEFSRDDPPERQFPMGPLDRQLID